MNVKDGMEKSSLNNIKYEICMHFVQQNPHNHNDVIIHLEPDILECEVKWALESITMNTGRNTVCQELKREHT